MPQLYRASPFPHADQAPLRVPKPGALLFRGLLFVLGVALPLWAGTALAAWWLL